MKKIIFLIISLLILTSCTQYSEEIRSYDETESVSDEDIFLSARWDSTTLCENRDENQIYADIRVSHRLPEKYMCEYILDGDVIVEGLFDKGIKENTFIGRADVYTNHTVKLCCNVKCVESSLDKLCIADPKLMEKEVLVEDFTTNSTEYFYFEAKALGQYQVYVNKQCDFCNDNRLDLEILTIEECEKKKNQEEYDVVFEIESKRSVLTRLSLPNDTQLCIAITAEDASVSKHILVKGSWIG